MNLHALRPLVEIIAAERTTTAPHLFDDAVQEGLIAAWKAENARPDAPRSYVVGAARNGVRSVLRGRPMTGQEGHRGWQDASDYTDEVDEASKVKATSADHDSAELSQVWGAVRRLESTEAHIATMRAYGYDWKQIGPRVGLQGEAARRRFVHHIAPRLASELAHLRGVA